LHARSNTVAVLSSFCVRRCFPANIWSCLLAYQLLLLLPHCHSLTLLYVGLPCWLSFLQELSAAQGELQALQQQLAAANEAAATQAAELIAAREAAAAAQAAAAAGAAAVGARSSAVSGGVELSQLQQQLQQLSEQHAAVVIERDSLLQQVRLLL
jgi:hypothetical protein